MHDEKKDVVTSIPMKKTQLWREEGFRDAQNHPKIFHVLVTVTFEWAFSLDRHLCTIS